MGTEVVNVLKGAWARVAQGWTQGTYARDASGKEVRYYDDSAVCWCPGGAIRAEASAEILYESLSTLRRTFSGGLITTWNDAPGRTQAEVLAKFDEAIALAEHPDPAMSPDEEISMDTNGAC